MSAAWIAGSVRARLLAAERRAGPEGARALAGAATFAEALAALGRGPYRREATHRLTPAGAQRAVAAKVLAELRLLAGWLPADALPDLRVLGGWYELANLEDRLGYLAGGRLRTPFDLGSLGVAWPAAAEAQSLAELRAALARTAWRDPGGETPAEIGLGLRLAWARRVAELPEAAGWAAGAVALLLARELYVVGVPVELLPLPAVPLLGTEWTAATTFAELVAALPPAAAAPFAGASGPDDLWRAELRWWRLVEEDAGRLVRSGTAGRGVVVGAVALLAADAHRVAAALAAAARRGLPGVEEAFDAAA